MFRFGLVPITVLSTTILFSALAHAASADVTVATVEVAHGSRDAIADAGDAARAVLLNAANAERAKNGATMLAEDSALDALATAYAREMAARNFFSHFTPEGLSPFDRMDKAGLQYGYAAENIALDSTPAEAATSLWNSPEHRENILGAHYRRIGIGTVVFDEHLYVVEDFID
jgi:uncharacterized protein YkwD